MRGAIGKVWKAEERVLCTCFRTLIFCSPVLCAVVDWFFSRLVSEYLNSYVPTDGWREKRDSWFWRKGRSVCRYLYKGYWRSEGVSVEVAWSEGYAGLEVGRAWVLLFQCCSFVWWFVLNVWGWRKKGVLFCGGSGGGGECCLGRVCMLAGWGKEYNGYVWWGGCEDGLIAWWWCEWRGSIVDI